jgi:hypothetical protein
MPEDSPTTSILEQATALMSQQQAGRSLTPITSWTRYQVGQQHKSIPLWVLRGSDVVLFLLDDWLHMVLPACFGTVGNNTQLLACDVLLYFNAVEGAVLEC